jgi:hypothetical protein
VAQRGVAPRCVVAPSKCGNDSGEVWQHLRCMFWFDEGVIQYVMMFMRCGRQALR